MLLHTLNAGADGSAFDNCLALLADGDALLLLGDGVYAAVASTGAAERLQQSGVPIYVLREDAAARGVCALLASVATLVDMDGFVTLTERFERIQAWY
jgi:tRNA 2-thiouridine synthesizing protein B